MVISIHAAREGGDVDMPIEARETLLFQSTPPVKAATPLQRLLALKHIDFNPRRP